MLLLTTLFTPMSFYPLPLSSIIIITPVRLDPLGLANRVYGLHVLHPINRFNRTNWSNLLHRYSDYILFLIQLLTSLGSPYQAASSLVTFTTSRRSLLSIIADNSSAVSLYRLEQHNIQEC